MSDPFELWRLAWSTAISRGLEELGAAVPAVAALERPRHADAVDLSAFPTLGHVRIELGTMLLLGQRRRPDTKTRPALIVAPYAVHDASIADFASGHSLAQVLAEAGPGLVALTFWKSAKPEMRDYGIDAYLSDLNVAIDDLGGRASLIGLCQGGWLAAAYAARFPGKVARLVLAGAPIDLAAAESGITRSLARVSPAAIQQLIAINGGRVSGPLSLAFWSLQGIEAEYTAEVALQCSADAGLEKRFNDWNGRAVDLPGLYFRQATEWLFRENRLACGCFPALGRPAKLSDIVAPVFVLAAAADEVVAAPQAIAAKALCRSTHVDVRVVPGRHLSLFMGRRTLTSAWPDIALWLEGDPGGRWPSASSGRSRIQR